MILKGDEKCKANPLPLIHHQGIFSGVAYLW